MISVKGGTVKASLHQSKLVQWYESILELTEFKEKNHLYLSEANIWGTDL